MSTFIERKVALQAVNRLLVLTRISVWLVASAVICLLSFAVYFVAFPENHDTNVEETGLTEFSWSAPDINTVPNSPEGDLIRYGEQLIRHTSTYLGPKGSVKPISNGMNCNNCHLDGGTKLYGNNYAGVFANYPKYRNRSGTIVDVKERVNECIERSLNGQRMQEDEKELNAMAAYILWLGKDVPNKVTPIGNGLKQLPFLDRAADPVKGQLVYETQCVVCHGKDGQGLMKATGNEYEYPPLVGDHSYNQGAGLYRLSRFASFVKYNMPFGVDYSNPILTDEEAWDVAAYVNSLPRPGKDLSNDWPDISKKPFDHPFGPFADEYTEQQHKYGPFKQMLLN